MRQVYALLFFPLLAASGSLKAQMPTAEEIFKNIERHLSGVDDYVVDLETEVKMERLRMPRMKAKLYFKKPDKVHFESSNFAMLPREGILMNPSRLRELYDVKLERNDTLGGKDVYRLMLAAKDEKSRLRQLYLWIDPASWTIARMETIPYDGRTLTIDFNYSLQEGKYRLPSTMQATFSGFHPDTARTVGTLPPEVAPQLQELQRMPRGGIVTIKYSNYRINVGLKDAIFEQKRRE